MVLKIEDRVRETTTTTGTGTYSLGGAVAGFQSFVTAIGDGNTTYYAVVNRNADEWELGIGTVADATPDTLARTTVISSSNSDSAVSFSAGTKDVFVTLPSSKSTFINGSNSLVIGNGAAGVDYSLTFDGESNDGVITWKEDEDYFLFSDDILMNSTEKIQFGDTASFIQQSSDGTLRIDGEAIIDLNASTRVDVSGDIKVGGEVQTANIGFTDGDNAIVIVDGGGVTLSTSLTLASGSTVTSIKDEDDMASDSATALATQQSIKAFVAASVTAEDLDITTDSGTIAIDLDSETLTVAGGTGLASSASSNTVTLAVDAAQTGITSVVNTSLEIGRDADNRIKFGTDNQIIFEVSGGDNVIFKASGEIEASSLDISGDVDVDGTLETDALSINGTAVTSTAAELNILDGVTSTAAELNILDGVTSTAAELNILDGVTATATELNYSDTGASVGTVVASKVVTADANKDVASFRNITLTGELDAGSLDVSGDADIDGTLEADAITVNGTALATVIAGTTVSNVTVSDSTTNSNFPVVFHDESNALLDDTGALRYNPSTGELLVPKLTVAGTTTTVDTVTMQAENAIIFEGATADANETTLTIVDPTGDRTISLPNVSGTLPVLAAASTTQITSTPEELNILDGVTATTAELNIMDGVTATTAELNTLDGVTAVVGELNALDLGSTAVGTAIASKAVILDSNKDYTGIRNLTITGELDGATLDISGDADIDGTLEADAITIDGTAINTVIAGVTVTNATNATNSAHVSVADNESTNENNLIPFIEDESATGNVGLESDGDFTYNPSTGRLTATQLAGTLQTAAQANVTSLGTLTTLTVDNVIINGSTIGHTGDTDLMTVASGILTVAGEVSMTTLDIGGTNVTSTAAELNILDGVTSTAAELNIMDGVTATTAELNIMDGVTATTAELNYTDGVTSNIQTQLDTKASKGLAVAMAIAL
jgi:cytoskeletal protein CcmA (bactofilin family)